MARQREVPVSLADVREDGWMLETPAGAAVLARVRSVLCVDSAVDLDSHARRVALDALRAKVCPRTPFARPSLVLERS
jgi:hypothetical protein